MILKVSIEDNNFSIQVPEDILAEGGSFFEKMDEDMSKGWLMSREWVENPDPMQRCQIAADRLADAMNTENETLVHLMAGYILTRMPGIKEVHIDTSGEMTETRFVM